MNYNIIEKDEIIIGYAEDLIRYLKDEIIRLIEEDIDNLYIEDMAELIKELKKKDYNELFKVSPCQMGGYILESLEVE